MLLYDVFESFALIFCFWNMLLPERSENPAQSVIFDIGALKWVDFAESKKLIFE